MNSLDISNNTVLCFEFTEQDIFVMITIMNINDKVYKCYEDGFVDDIVHSQKLLQCAGKTTGSFYRKSKIFPHGCILIVYYQDSIPDNILDMNCIFSRFCITSNDNSLILFYVFEEWLLERYDANAVAEFLSTYEKSITCRRSMYVIEYQNRIIVSQLSDINQLEVTVERLTNKYGDTALGKFISSTKSPYAHVYESNANDELTMWNVTEYPRTMLHIQDDSNIRNVAIDRLCTVAIETWPTLCRRKAFDLHLQSISELTETKKCLQSMAAHKIPNMIIMYFFIIHRYLFYACIVLIPLESAYRKYF